MESTPNQEKLTPLLTPPKKKSYCKNGEVRFNLKRQGNKKDNLQIFLIFNFDGKRLRYYTGKRTNLGHWDAKNQRVKNNVDGSTGINRWIKSLGSHVVHEYDTAKSLKKNPSIEYLREKLKEFDSKSINSFIGTFEEFISRSKNTKAPTTVIKYENALKHLQDFAIKKNYKLEFESINFKFEEKFRDYLISNLKHNNNTVAKIFKVIKVFMKYAVDVEKTRNYDFLKFNTREFKGEIIYLTWEELMHVYNKDIENKTLEKIRDIFCFGCFTGLRYSDLMNLGCDSIVDGNIRITTIKNKKAILIPLNRFSQAIADKYLLKDAPDGRLLPQISNQKMNDYLKDLGKLCDLDEKVNVVNYKGAERIDSSVPKHDLLSTHVARKTFITNAINRGMSSDVLMELTSHSTYEAFKRYLKIFDEKKKDEMNRVFN